MTTSRGERGTEATRAITGRDLVSFLRGGMAFAVIVALIAGGTAFIVTSASSPVYRATVVLLASQPAGSYGALDVITPPQVDPSVYRSALLEGPVLADALRRVEGRSLSERQLELFSRKVRVSVDNQQISSVVRIEVRDEVPEYAARVANVIAEELSAWDRERARQSFARSVSAIERAIQDLEAEIAAVDAGAGAEGVERAALVAERDQRFAELSAARTMGAGAVVVGLLEPMRLAAPPERPVGPRVVFSTLVAMLVGLVGGYGVLFARWSLDTRVAGRDDVVALTGLPVLAEFPRRGRRAHRLAGESGRFLRTNVLLATGDSAPRVIAITSPQTPAEKEGVAVSLAESFAKAGYRTLLIDGDLRHPATSELLDVELLASSPWEDVELANPYQRYLPVTVGVDAMHAFDFVPSFASAWYRVDVLHHAFRQQLLEWKQRYEVIIVDSTPVVPYADTLAIAPLCTALVLCASLSRSNHVQVSESLELLRQSHVNVIGVVLTDARVSPRRRQAEPIPGESPEERQARNPYTTAVQESGPEAPAPRARPGGRR